jgi:ectoine hydroxylase-related dioxygenase (phytanoyl-CoA dioxygenase family)
MVAVWLALTSSTSESGCMRVIAGSHKRGRLPHVSRPHPDNLLKFGSLEVDCEVDDTSAVDVELQPGQISLHHGDAIHGSTANRSDHWRTGIVIRYVPPEVKITAPLYRVIMARGRDTHGHYRLLEQVPPLDTASSVAGHTAYREWHDRTFHPPTSAESPSGRVTVV